MYAYNYCAVPENTYTPPREGFLFFPSPLPPGNSSLASYFASKILTFETLFLLGISGDLPLGGCGFFLKPHIETNVMIQYMYIHACDKHPNNNSYKKAGKYGPD